MSERTIFNGIMVACLILGIVVFTLLFFITAPYGRHSRKGWGPSIDNKAGWMVMESAAALLFAFFFFSGTHHDSSTAIIFLIMWEAHYLHRAFIYPLTLHGPTKRMPMLIIAFGLSFNIINAYLNGRYLFDFSGGYRDAWLSDPRFILGSMLFLAGFMVNRHSDRVLGGRACNLVWLGDSYMVPYGSDFRYMDSSQSGAKSTVQSPVVQIKIRRLPGRAPHTYTRYLVMFLDIKQEGFSPLFINRFVFTNTIRKLMPIARLLFTLRQ
jgi:3-oxo-5-alpha-steroid 4-dehydrogenase 1